MEGNRARQCIAGFLQYQKLCLREPGSYHAPGPFSFKAALKVQRKESNGVAGLAVAGSSLDRVKLRQFVPSLRCGSMTNVRARTPAKIDPGTRPELLSPNAAAQTRIVSAGEFWPSRQSPATLMGEGTLRNKISGFETVVWRVRAPAMLRMAEDGVGGNTSSSKINARFCQFCSDGRSVRRGHSHRAVGIAAAAANRQPLQQPTRT